MDIFVQIFNGKQIRLTQINPDKSISYLKQKISAKEGILPWRQTLVFGTKELLDDQLIGSYHIRNESVIKLFPSMKSGPMSYKSPAGAAFAGASRSAILQTLLQALTDADGDAESPHDVHSETTTLFIGPDGSRSSVPTSPSSQCVTQIVLRPNRRARSCFQMINDDESASYSTESSEGSFEDAAESVCTIDNENARTSDKVKELQQKLNSHNRQKRSKKQSKKRRRKVENKMERAVSAPSSRAHFDPSLNQSKARKQLTTMLGSSEKNVEKVNLVTLKPTQINLPSKLRYSAGEYFPCENKGQLNQEFPKVSEKFSVVGPRKISRSEDSGTNVDQCAVRAATRRKFSVDPYCMVCDKTLGISDVHSCKCRRTFCKKHSRPQLHDCVALDADSNDIKLNDT